MIPNFRLNDDRYSQVRANSGDRGYRYRWSKAAKAYRKRHPLCVQCLSEGRTTEATEVDHIVPHRGDQRLFWDVTNWQSLCRSCHSKKTKKGQ